jgi:hypothetical protein
MYIALSNHQIIKGSVLGLLLANDDLNNQSTINEMEGPNITISFPSFHQTPLLRTQDLTNMLTNFDKSQNFATYTLLYSISSIPKCASVT